MKFITYIDYKADYTAKTGKSTSYIEFEADSNEVANEITKNAYNPETMWLVKTMEKTGKIEKAEGWDGWKKQKYTAIACYQRNEWTTVGEHEINKLFDKYGNTVYEAC